MGQQLYFDNYSAVVVRRLAEIFADLNYSVLYEGVEDEKDEKDEKDEQRCIQKRASYLQGYKIG